MRRLESLKQEQSPRATGQSVSVDGDGLSSELSQPPPSKLLFTTQGLQTANAILTELQTQNVVPDRHQGHGVSAVPQPTRSPLRLRDDHFVIPTALDPKTRYFGRSSVFSLTVDVLARAESDFVSLLPPNRPYTHAEPTWQANDLDGWNCTIPETLVRSTVDAYLSSLNILYPMLDPMIISNSIETYLDLQSSAREPSTRDEIFQVFQVAMMMAVSFASRCRHSPRWIMFDNVCHLQASKYIEIVTSEASMESLQALMLSIIYYLFRPRKGDIWKLLDYACRLSIELGCHTEPIRNDEEDLPDQEARRKTFWSLYAIERIVGQILGRPSDLPETMFTTKFPDTAANDVSEDEHLTQQFSAMHHYRIVYLRSEVYRDIYLPSYIPEYPLEWYESRLARILDWYRHTRTTNPEENLEGVGTITCSVAFHSTIIFLFQPIILRCLQKGRDKNADFHEYFPEDSFFSACRLVQVYEKVIRAPQSSPLGLYPMTFMSAHYCWMAAMTIAAHCLLLLDERMTAKRLVADPRVLQETEHISVSRILEVSNSCSRMLMFCAEQWPGMMGMVDFYSNLSSTLIPKIIQKSSQGLLAS